MSARLETLERSVAELETFMAQRFTQPQQPEDERIAVLENRVAELSKLVRGSR